MPEAIGKGHRRFANGSPAALIFFCSGKGEMRTFVAEGRHVLRETMITGGLRTITRTRNAAIQTI